MFDAISIGASNMVGPIGGMISNLIAFTSIFAFIDAVVIWFFGMINLENFGIDVKTFFIQKIIKLILFLFIKKSIMQYIFWPFAFLMGVDIDDCKVVSKLIGTKIFVNEFVAYNRLGKSIRFKEEIIKNNTFELYFNGTYVVPSDVFAIWNVKY